ncbi:hypothetical protein QR680_019014 [Steinernema hermaphroditum]|uniref:Secreted protein n=1 Tax=Steinernema hermaphroditum TaxID=289476 RepID=A0AA39HJP6_9BILA|nr:hypothetical protein QR680_019014 [Steinernema hermaphroditum]
MLVRWLTFLVLFAVAVHGGKFSSYTPILLSPFFLLQMVDGSNVFDFLKEIKRAALFECDDLSMTSNFRRCFVCRRLRSAATDHRESHDL